MDYSHFLTPSVGRLFFEHELDKYGPVKEKTEFKNKIDESIHRVR